MIDRLNAALEGRYRIEREVGEGGMATVYLAEDLKHKRQVALKVLRPELAAVVGAERFLAEIETTANLQHPHILPLFDSGEADGFLFYVMPYVEGESLRDRLDREKQLPVDQAVELTRKLASALQHAHDKGIVHRDIKPANILLSEGEPVVADFGIALAVNSAGGGRITETGLSLGTPHYMSPEQASGDRSLDPRSDVYALGCVLYEALAGEPPFPGPTPQAVLARILTGRAQRVSASRPTVPGHIDAVVARALEKLPADRFASVADFRKALDDPGFRHLDAGEETPAPAKSRPQPGRAGRWVAPAVVVLLAVLAVWGWLRPEPPAPFQAFKVVLDNAGPEFGPVMALSPTGDNLAYVTEAGGLAVKPLAAVDGRVLPVEEGSRTPFFSPDGSSVAFHTGTPEGSELRWVRIDGGGTIRVARGIYPGGAWSEDGYIYYTPDTDYSLWRVRAQGGEPERVPQPDGHEFTWPQAVEGGDRILVRSSEGADGVDRLFLLDPDTGELTPIEGPGLEQAAIGRHAGGYLFWVDADLNLLAARLDIRGSRLSSPAVTLATQTLASGGASVTVAENGTLAYATGIGARAGLMENLAWVERDGSVEVLEDRLAEQIGDFDGLAIGPGERYVAVQIDPPGELQDQRQEIWILDTRQSTLYPLTFDGADTDPEWLDAGHVAYIRRQEGRTDLYVQPFDRSGPERVLLESDRRIEDFEVGPDSSLLLVLAAGPDDLELGRGLYTVVPDEPDSLRRFVDTRFNERLPDISPDGRWVAYVSDESGRYEVYVRSFPQGGRPWPVSTEGGDTPRWGPNGDELYFRVGNRLVAAALDFTEGVNVTGYTELFSTVPFEMSGYQAHSDGERLLMIREGEGAETVSTVVMLNVFDEIERRLAQ